MFCLVIISFGRIPSLELRCILRVIHFELASVSLPSQQPAMMEYGINATRGCTARRDDSWWMCLLKLFAMLRIELLCAGFPTALLALS